MSDEFAVFRDTAFVRTQTGWCVQRSDVESDRHLREFRDLLSDGRVDAGRVLLRSRRSRYVVVCCRGRMPDSAVDASRAIAGCGRRRYCSTTLRQPVCLGNDVDHYWHDVPVAHVVGSHVADQAIVAGGAGSAWRLYVV